MIGKKENQFADLDIKKLSREDLEQAYRDLLEVSDQKTHLIGSMAFDLKKANADIKLITERK